MTTHTKKEKIIIATTSVILLAIILFAVFNWKVISYLFKEMTEGVTDLGEFVRGLGIVGVLAITLIIIACFFVPVISSVPLQIVSAVSYGMFFGIVHVSLSIFLASQLAFLFTRTVRVFTSEKHKKAQKEMEEKIKNSKRSIFWFLVLAYLAPFVPFMIIHIVAADSGMKWWKYSLVTLLGPIPDILVTLWAGVKITTSSSSIVSFIILMVVIVCVVLSLIYKNKIIDAIFAPKENEKKDGTKE